MRETYIVEIEGVGTLGFNDFLCLYIGKDAAERAAERWNDQYTWGKAKALQVGIAAVDVEEKP